MKESMDLKRMLRHYDELFYEMNRLLKESKMIKIAIDGNCGAGKSTLASMIGELYDCNVFHLDDFFLTPELKTEARLKEIGGNVDYVRFKNEVLAKLEVKEAFNYQVYDCKKMSLGKWISVSPKKLNIIEGSYCMHPTLINNYDFKVFLSVDEREQKDRILKRNGPILYKRFIDEWIPKENAYFFEMNIKEKCDLVMKGFND